ncbi:gametocyte-specific factor 1 homolog [Eurosta solidaginis]|uniref:gametocyte-specific factor 1 homolog n=1 Tax=Eurosta solidaginis TaxID=178769 RepID=UPI0035314E79
MNDEYVQCPYDKSHVILKTRFQVHLVRCKKNHKGVGKKTCPFNVTHIVDECDLDEHVKTCPNRAGFEKFKVKEQTNAAVENAEETQEQLLETAECWDDLPPAPTYDPKKYTTNAPVLRLMQGQSKAKKKQFRAQERLRLSGIDNNN